MTRTMRQTEACSSFVRIQHGRSRSEALFRCSCGSPFSSQLVIYWRFVVPLDVWYWRKRYPPASVWNDLGFHKPVLGGKRRAESTASINSNNNPVTVIDYANPNHNPNHQRERCRLCSSLTTANRFMRTQIVSHREGTFYVSIRRPRGVTNRRYITSWDENGLVFFFKNTCTVKGMVYITKS